MPKRTLAAASARLATEDPTVEIGRLALNLQPRMAGDGVIPESNAEQ